MLALFPGCFAVNLVLSNVPIPDTIFIVSPNLLLYDRFIILNIIYRVHNPQILIAVLSVAVFIGK